MKIKRLSAENFRNIESCDISFSDGVNLLVGDNAEGKTNAVEAIYLFARGRSHRSTDDRDMIRFGKEGFRLLIEYETLHGRDTLEYACFGRLRQRKKNGYKLKNLAEMLGSFKCVLFYPDNLEIVKDGPDERRAFLNIALSQIYPVYLEYYTKYKEALDARNKLLKLAREMPISNEEIEAWSLSMAEYASYIYILRSEYLKRLEVHASRICRELSGGEELSLSYKSNINEGAVRLDEAVSFLNMTTNLSRELVKSEYYKLLTRDISREIAAGTSLFGVQRDDIIITLEGKEARLFASQGQKRSIVLSLKLAEGEVIRDVFGEYPVFLFDDVLSELDGKRRQYLIEGMGDRQIIITSCEGDELESLASLIIEVKGGHYVPSYR